jgi:hypothetical protein
MKKIVEKLKKKPKTYASSQDMIIEVLRRRTEKWRHMTPHDIWKKILLKVEITRVLDLGVKIPEVQRVLVDDAFWKSKFAYDFPDMVEFVGGDALPEWITPGDPSAVPEFRDLPWRRYYYVVRPFMRRLAKKVLELVKTQDAANVYREMAHHPFIVRGTLIPGSTFMVSVTRYWRMRDKEGHRARYFTYMDLNNLIDGSEAEMTVWEFASRYIVSDMREIAIPLINERHNFQRVNRGERRWFHRNQNTETNIIQLAVVMPMMLDQSVEGGGGFPARSWNHDPPFVRAMLAWLLHLRPTRADIWFSGTTRKEEKDREDTFREGTKWSGGKFLFMWPEPYLETLTVLGRTLIKDKNRGPGFLIGNPVILIGSGSVCVVCGDANADKRCTGCKHEVDRVYCSKTCFGKDLHIALCGSKLNTGAAVEAVMHKYGAKWGKGKTWVSEAGNAEYFNFRKELVDALLVHVITDIVKCPTSECSAVSVGSTTLFSDYDLTVTAPPKRAAEIVDAFNREFRQLFGNRESATVFDTNVYGVTWLIPGTREDKIFVTFTAVGSRAFSMVRAVNPQRQRFWAYVKLNLHTDKGLPAKMRNAHYRSKVNRANITAMNKEYVAQLYNVARVAQHGDPAKYEDAVSTANYYGAETYFTQGAFLHVVGEIQMGLRGIPITVDQYLDSAIENLGECLKELKLSCEYEHVSKYFARAMDALIKAHPTHPRVSYLRELYNAAEAVRVEVRGHRINVRCGQHDSTCVLPQRAAALKAEFDRVLLHVTGMVNTCDLMHTRIIEILTEFV